MSKKRKKPGRVNIKKSEWEAKGMPHPNSYAGFNALITKSKEGLKSGQQYQVECSGTEQCAGSNNTMLFDFKKSIASELGLNPNKYKRKYRDAWDKPSSDYNIIFEDEFYKTQIDNKISTGNKNPLEYKKTLPNAALFQPVKPGEVDPFEGAIVTGKRETTESSIKYSAQTKKNGNTGTEHQGVFSKLIKHPETGEYGRYIYHSFAPKTDENGDGKKTTQNTRTTADFVSPTDGWGWTPEEGDKEAQNKYSIAQVFQDKELYGLLKAKKEKENAEANKMFEQIDKKTFVNSKQTQTPLLTNKQKAQEFYKTLPGSGYMNNKKPQYKLDGITKVANMFRYGGKVNSYRPGGLVGDPPFGGPPYSTTEIKPIQLDTTGVQQGLNIAASSSYNPYLEQDPYFTNAYSDGFDMARQKLNNAAVGPTFDESMQLLSNQQGGPTFDKSMQILSNADQDYDITTDPMFKQGLNLNNNLVRKGGEPQFNGDGNPMQPYIDIFSNDNNGDGNPMQPYIDLFSGEQQDDLKAKNEMLSNQSTTNKDAAVQQAAYQGYIPDPNQNQNTNVKAKTKNISDKANIYHNMMLGADIGMLASNLLQQPPPRQDFSRSALSRIDIDMNPFQVERSKQQENINRSIRKAREQAGGQFSNLAKILQATQIGGQEGLRNIETAQRQALDKENLMNIEISNKEQMINDQQRDKEMQTNYALMSAFYAQRSDAVSKSINAIKQDFRNMADYSIKKDYITRQSKVNEDQVKRQDAINALVAMKELGSNVDTDPRMLKDIQDQQSKMLSDISLGLNTKYGMSKPNELVLNEKKLNYATALGKTQNNIDKLGEKPQLEDYDDLVIPTINDFEDIVDPTITFPKGVDPLDPNAKPLPSTVTQTAADQLSKAMASYETKKSATYDKDLSNWNKNNSAYTKELKNLETIKQDIELEENYMKEFNAEKLKRGYDELPETIRKSYGIPNNQELTKELLKMISQSFSDNSI